MEKYKTLKEARKAARILLSKESPSRKVGISIIRNKKDVSYVIIENHFRYEDVDFLVHRDGRICKVSELLKERKKNEKHGKRVFPFVWKMRNRLPNEDKKEYLKKMAIDVW